MAEVAKPGLGDLLSLGVLLALLHRADAAFDQVAASYRIWCQEERASAARWRRSSWRTTGRRDQQLCLLR